MTDQTVSRSLRPPSARLTAVPEARREPAADVRGARARPAPVWRAPSLLIAGAVAGAGLTVSMRQIAGDAADATMLTAVAIGAAITAFTLSPGHAAEEAEAKGGSAIDLSDLSAWTMQKEGAWVVKDGEIQPAAEKKQAGGYLWSKEKFEDFRLSLEFKMSEKCNSGVFFRTDPKNAVQGGFEIQVFDSAGKDEVGSHDCGALYDAKAPSVNAAKPPGEWNQMVITAKGPKITVELNGQEVVNVNIDDWTTANQNPDGSKNKFKTALKEIPRNNHLGIQYHGHPVWYRNLSVERL